MPSNTDRTTGEVLFLLLGSVGTLYLIGHIIRQIKRWLSQTPKSELENLAETIKKLPAHTQLIIGNTPQNTNNNNNNAQPSGNNAQSSSHNAQAQLSPNLSDNDLEGLYDRARDQMPAAPPPTARGMLLPASDGRRALAGWTGLSYGVPLGLGLGVIGCGGVMFGAAPMTAILAMVIWCIAYRPGEADPAIRAEGPEMEAEIRVLKYQAVVFGIVLGVGFGVLLGGGLYRGVGLYRVAIACGGWAFVWFMVGGGVTWEHEAGKLRLEWVFIGELWWKFPWFAKMGRKLGPRGWWVLCGLVVVGALMYVLGARGQLWWVLCGLVGAVMAAVGFGGPPSNAVGQGSGMGPGPGSDGRPDGSPPFDGRPDGGSPSDGRLDGDSPFGGSPDGGATEQREESGTPADSETSWINESPDDQLRGEDGATDFENNVRAEPPSQARSNTPNRPASRGRLIRERKGLGIADDNIDDGGLGR